MYTLYLNIWRIKIAWRKKFWWHVCTWMFGVSIGSCHLLMMSCTLSYLLLASPRIIQTGECMKSSKSHKYAKINNFGEGWFSAYTSRSGERIIFTGSRSMLSDWFSQCAYKSGVIYLSLNETTDRKIIFSTVASISGWFYYLSPFTHLWVIIIASSSRVLLIKRVTVFSHVLTPEKHGEIHFKHTHMYVCTHVLLIWSLKQVIRSFLSLVILMLYIIFVSTSCHFLD